MFETTSRWKYVGVWLLAAFLGNIASKLLIHFVYSGARSRDDVISAMAIGIPLEAVAVGIIFVAVYSAFSSLDMSVVFPWMIGLVSLGTVINLAGAATAGFLPGWIYIYQITCTAAMLFGIRAFFKAKGRMS